MEPHRGARERLIMSMRRVPKLEPERAELTERTLTAEERLKAPNSRAELRERLEGELSVERPRRLGGGGETLEALLWPHGVCSLPRPAALLRSGSPR